MLFCHFCVFRTLPTDYVQYRSQAICPLVHRGGIHEGLKAGRYNGSEEVFG